MISFNLRFLEEKEGLYLFCLEANWMVLSVDSCYLFMNIEWLLKGGC